MLLLVRAALQIAHHWGSPFFGIFASYSACPEKLALSESAHSEGVALPIHEKRLSGIGGRWPPLFRLPNTPAVTTACSGRIRRRLQAAIFRKRQRNCANPERVPAGHGRTVLPVQLSANIGVKENPATGATTG